MRLTAIEDTVENGQVRLPADVRLPENAKVYVVIPGVEERAVPYIGSPRLAHPSRLPTSKRKSSRKALMATYDAAFFRPLAPVPRLVLRALKRSERNR